MACCMQKLPNEIRRKGSTSCVAHRKDCTMDSITSDVGQNDTARSMHIHGKPTSGRCGRQVQCHRPRERANDSLQAHGPNGPQQNMNSAVSAQDVFVGLSVTHPLNRVHSEMRVSTLQASHIPPPALESQQASQVQDQRQVPAAQPRSPVTSPSPYGAASAPDAQVAKIQYMRP